MESKPRPLVPSPHPKGLPPEGTPTSPSAPHGLCDSSPNDYFLVLSQAGSDWIAGPPPAEEATSVEQVSSASLASAEEVEQASSASLARSESGDAEGFGLSAMLSTSLEPEVEAESEPSGKAFSGTWLLRLTVLLCIGSRLMSWLLSEGATTPALARLSSPSAQPAGDSMSGSTPANRSPRHNHGAVCRTLDTDSPGGTSASAVHSAERALLHCRVTPRTQRV